MTPFMSWNHKCLLGLFDVFPAVLTRLLRRRNLVFHGHTAFDSTNIFYKVSFGVEERFSHRTVSSNPSSSLLCLLYSKHVSQHPDTQVLRGSDRHFLPHIRTHIGKKHSLSDITEADTPFSSYIYNDVSNTFGSNTIFSHKVHITC